MADALAAVRECDIVTLPSHDEGFPRAVLEAMALGKPIVATRVGGVPEAIEDGMSGLLVPPGDVPGLVTAWGRLLDDPGLPDRLAAAARTRVAERFTLSAYLRGVEDQLDLALAAR